MKLSYQYKSHSCLSHFYITKTSLCFCQCLKWNNAKSTVSCHENKCDNMNPSSSQLPTNPLPPKALHPQCFLSDNSPWEHRALLWICWSVQPVVWMTLPVWYTRWSAAASVVCVCVPLSGTRDHTDALNCLLQQHPVAEDQGSTHPDEKNMCINFLQLKITKYGCEQKDPRFLYFGMWNILYLPQDIWGIMMLHHAPMHQILTHCWVVTENKIHDKPCTINNICKLCLQINFDWRKAFQHI